MFKIERKILKGKPFFYLTEQTKIKNKYKKIQVYIGKAIPNDLANVYRELQSKEISLVSKNIGSIFKTEKHFSSEQLLELEKLRLSWKYYLANLSTYEAEIFWRKFAIQFIYESNAIEGSRLSSNDVQAILRAQYIKKSIESKEIIEVNNSIEALNLVRNKKFILNERSLIGLHKIIVRDLGVKTGFKKNNIVVNNKTTAPVGEIRIRVSELIRLWKKQIKSGRHPFLLALDFHQSFESIHPFADGNGRVGRLLLNWILLGVGYPPILIRTKNRLAYFNALSQADEARPRKWYWFAFKTYKETLKWILSKS